MHRTTTLALASLALLTRPAAASDDELAATLQRAVDAAGSGRCDDALALTRVIATADAAFYAAHVPTQPVLAACVRERIARPAPPPPPPRRATAAASDGPSTVGNFLLAAGAGTAAFFGLGLLANQVAYGDPTPVSLEDDEGGPTTEFFVASSLGATLAPAMVVYLANRDDRHDSSLPMTIGGSMLFGLAGTALGYPMLSDSPALGVALIIASPAVGAIVGDRLGRRLRKLPVEIMPTAGAGQLGAVVGGQF